ncbi:uncharacterized protein LOC110054523 [Orbicella faveolata]|uniref:uncharacterized protein LOC110054523 n=1 Tax=Orbicella faveolata TaxID=48498 RepID=UPI0009E60B04|nr:uncharacterized protein LOC110054523 [Orbicella faveolata]
MACCPTLTAEDKLEPYQLRALYIRQISKFAQTGIFGQALNVFKEISNNLGVNASTKRLSNLAVSDLLAGDEFLVDRDAYRYLQR